LHRLRPCWAALAAFAFAACADTQSPEESPTDPSLNPTTSLSLPVLQTMQLKKASANASNAYSITLRFINEPTAAQREFFEVAAAKWQGILVGDVPDASGVIPARSCGNDFPTPPFSGGVDDVLIDVLLQPIDGPGAVLGAAGPCLARNADLLTLYGIMFFDTDDLDFLQQFDILDEVVVHEMGHVLGIGTLWNFGRTLLQGTAADPRFVGPSAIAGFHEVGGRGSSIPVEEDGGSGTAFGHWDDETFDTELMTGFIATGESPLSVMTIGSMRDLGYEVNPAAADPYKVQGRQERVDEGQTTAAMRVNLAGRERLLRPLMIVK
jgi:hypothetical protein